jgi:modulator of FtsH protease HflC
MVKSFYIWLLVAFIGVSAIGNSFVIVDELHTAVIFQFGKAVRQIEKPGLYYKTPFIQSVQSYEKRLFCIPIAAKELTASDSKRVIIDAFAYLRITDPTVFYKSVFSYDDAKTKVCSRLESSIRKVIGRHSLAQLLSSARGSIMQEISMLLNAEVEDFGMKVVDVRISRADLPQENSAAICRRMQTAREQEATGIRAEGNAEAARIKADADKTKKILLADAYAKSELIRGQGEAKASEIYNKSYCQDEEFFYFYRSMQTYAKVFGDGDSQFIVSPNSGFMKSLKLGE